MSTMTKGIVVIFLVWGYSLVVLLIIIKKVKYLRKAKITEIQARDVLEPLIYFFAAAAPFAFPAMFIWVFGNIPIRSFLLKIIQNIINSMMGAGLFSGFITTLTVGLGYFFVVASFFFNDEQRRFAAMSGFLTGQFVMFTMVYCPRFHQVLVRPHCLVVLFLGSFLIQIFWTRRKTLPKERFLNPEDVFIMQRRRVLRLQLEFMMSFFAQICNPYLETDSFIPRLVIFSTANYTKLQNVFFIGIAFVGWVVGHIYFMLLFIQLFEFTAILIVWLRRNFFEK